MAVRSLNKVQLIGNLTRDPELRYTPAGTAVCTFGLATNRSWTTQSGETKEDTEFHRIVSWNKLAELCAQLLSKGRKVYVEGRLATHTWTGQDNVQRTTTEIVIEDMIILDSKKKFMDEGDMQAMRPTSAKKEVSVAGEEKEETPKKTEKKEEKKEEKKSTKTTSPKAKKAKKEEKEEKKEEVEPDEDITPDDIPF